MDRKLIKAVLSFCADKQESEKLELRPLIPAFALLHYMRRSIVEIHEFAKLQGYQGGYNAFAKWLRRNVDFEAECAKYADEFKAIATGSRPASKPDSDATDTGSATASSGTDVFAPRISEAPDIPATGLSEAEPSVSKPPKEADSNPSPRDVLNKWQAPSYEDQIEKLGLDKRKTR